MAPRRRRRRRRRRRLLDLRRLIAPGTTTDRALPILIATGRAPRTRVRNATSVAGARGTFAARSPRPRRRLRPAKRDNVTLITLRRVRAPVRATPMLIVLTTVAAACAASPVPPSTSTATAGNTFAWIPTTSRASKARSRRSGKHLPAHEKNWLSAARNKNPLPNPSPV